MALRSGEIIVRAPTACADDLIVRRKSVDVFRYSIAAGLKQRYCGYAGHFGFELHAKARYNSPSWQ